MSVASLLRAVALACGLGLALGTAVHGQSGPPVAAASDLQFALDEVAARFEADTGQELRITYGSSGTFAGQLRQGAPFELFLSADESFVFELADAGRTLDRGALYAQGRIVLFAPKGSPLTADERFSDLGAALEDGRVQRFAIANPEHAPYGRAAQQALESRGLWEAAEPRLVLGENVSQAAQFATSGSTEGGIFAYSLALSPEVGPLGTYVLIPEEWHQPLRQRMVLMRDAGAVARAFYDYLRTEPARAVFRRYGFVLPDEEG